MNKNSQKIRFMSANAILIALTVALSFLSNYISFGTVNINLALIVIVIGACIYGPICGLSLGLVNGLITVFAPGTQAFMSISVWATVLTCLIKTGVAGLISGLIFKTFKKKNELVSSVVASISVPILNTSIFIIFTVCFFMKLFGNFVGLLTAVISINFVIELVVISVLSPAIYRLIKIINKRNIKESE